MFYPALFYFLCFKFSIYLISKTYFIKNLSIKRTRRKHKLNKKLNQFLQTKKAMKKTIKLIKLRIISVSKKDMTKPCDKVIKILNDFLTKKNSHLAGCRKRYLNPHLQIFVCHFLVYISFYYFIYLFEYYKCHLLFFVLSF